MAAWKATLAASDPGNAAKINLNPPSFVVVAFDEVAFGDEEVER